ncbi:hypothetical protein TS85_02190 [Sphingomonas hengshuiensis]|uniref:Uncharacterized protein n=1 Tax=Sphingomonas hengshuiensis TaxID=1609977 RepID=A0A7U5BEP5_9SPHN|nr:hypothetical protein TS85_02190 [Sphingomonas hengshuiensis]
MLRESRTAVNANQFGIFSILIVFSGMVQKVNVFHEANLSLSAIYSNVPRRELSLVGSVSTKGAPPIPLLRMLD